MWAKNHAGNYAQRKDELKSLENAGEGRDHAYQTLGMYEFPNSKLKMDCENLPPRIAATAIPPHLRVKKILPVILRSWFCR